MTTSLSIVIPAYNEATSLGFVLDDTLKKLPTYIKDFEVIIVDDGSNDGTSKIADSYAKKYTQVKVIHQKNGGYNKAMIAGIKAASKKFVGYFQADGQNLVDDFKGVYPLLPKFDLIIIGRGKPKDYNIVRLFFHYGGFLLYFILFGLRYQDPHWVYFWRTSKIQEMTLDPNGGVFLLVESLVKFRRSGLRILEMPSVEYRSRMGGEQKAVKLKVILRTIASVFRLWWQIITKKI